MKGGSRPSAYGEAGVGVGKSWHPRGRGMTVSGARPRSARLVVAAHASELATASERAKLQAEARPPALDGHHRYRCFGAGGGV